ncbi:heparin lyase I family protein [Mesorhizobium sp. BAC0120]|uniref:heparin lyase I family protein n=1 Tax=Mesorhizobium sp. BAC0120 TaxID=3090670 RepID=UPI00298CA296|nr:heparin lyase I family protein [Mesorhizobium sp. BAC0120]MDW6021501.1 heparin lyase I family protein [Mesorhizobium sp. BAC0120]
MAATSGRAEIIGIERQLIKPGEDPRAQFQTRTGHMNFCWKTAICLYVVVIGPALAGDKWSDDFSTSELNRSLWSPCQINMDKAPIEFLHDPDDPGSQFARITVDINSLGGKKCRKEPPGPRITPLSAFSPPPDRPVEESDEPNLHGPSFNDTKTIPFAAVHTNGDPYCDSAIIQRALAAGEEGECIQRQELRFQSQYIHAADEPFTYKLRFRMPAVIQDTKNSVRWVIAQWKEEPISPVYEDPSPALAQRFDDGVLHVTVQDEDCRCRVASAPMPDGSIWPARPGVARDCISTRPSDPANTACTANLTVEYGADPVLPSPRGAWVDMQYRVQMSRSKAAAIEIYANGRFVARVTGKIGYEPAPGKIPQVKFKIGHYRDYLPSIDTMDIDRVEVERSD